MTSLSVLIFLALCCGWLKTAYSLRFLGFKSPSLPHLEGFSPRFGAAAAVAAALALSPTIASARPEGVNRPDLLPSGPVSPIIDTANFLTKGQEKKIVTKLEQLEKSTGYKLRVLCQSYPNTPGLAIKDYWKVDDNTVVLVLDRGEGFNRKGIPSNIINLNIGANVELVLPSQFWTRVTNKLGNQPYIRAVGADAATINAVEAISYCLEDKTCTDVPFDVQL